MQVHVRTPRTKIDIDGKISDKLLKVLKEDYGKHIIVEDDEWVNAVETKWFKKTMKNMTPNDFMRTYRESRGITQAELGKKLGGLTRQRISDIENGRRIISKDIAKKLAEIFKTSVSRFL